MLQHEFMRSALLAGVFIGLAGGLTGYFVVLRAQVFAGDALSHVAFTGALAAGALGIDIRAGLLASTVFVAMLIGAFARDTSTSDDVVIGSVFAWVLGIGVLFLSLYTTSSSAGNGTAAIRVLFGSIFGLSHAQAVWTAVVCTCIAAAMLGMARPLLFSSLDPDVARTRGVPVRLLTLAFMALFGVEAAEATQAVGALLLLTLLAAPAGAARLLTANPWRGALLSSALAVAAVVVGLVVSYRAPQLPPSFTITAVAAATYLGAGIARSQVVRGRWRRRRAPAAPTTA